MPSVNDDLIETAFLAELRRRGADDALVAAIERIIRDEVLPDVANALNNLPFDSLKVSDLRLIEMRNAITDAMGWERVTSKLTKGSLDAAAAEALASGKELEDTLPIIWNSIIPSPDLLIKIVLDKPFNGRTLTGWFSELGKTAQDDIYQSFRIGMIEGKSIPQMSKDLLERSYDSFTGGGINKVFNNAEAVVRTATNYAGTQTRLAFAELNSDVIKGVEYIATLDDKTSFTCMSLHGTVYAIDEVGPIPPQHYGCRSTLAYVTKSWDELNVVGGRDFEFKQAFRDTGAGRMDGITSKPLSFNEWLGTKSIADQNNLLGPVRAQMWRDGKIDNVTDFVNVDGGTIPLKDFGVNQAGNPIDN